MKNLRLYLLLLGLPFLGGLVSIAQEYHQEYQVPPPNLPLLGLTLSMNKDYSDTMLKGFANLRLGDLVHAARLFGRGVRMGKTYENKVWYEFEKSGCLPSRLRVYQSQRLNTDILIECALDVEHQKIGRPGVKADRFIKALERSKVGLYLSNEAGILNQAGF